MIGHRKGKCMNIVCEGSFRIRKGGLETHRAQYEAFHAATKGEPGCIDFSLSYDALNETTIYVIERWKSREDLIRHLNTQHVKTWIDVMQDFMATEMDVRIYEAMPEKFRV